MQTTAGGLPSIKNSNITVSYLSIKIYATSKALFLDLTEKLIQGIAYGL